jgi:3-oxoacyl-[acyl-carrier-protein] synthase-3
MGLSLGLLGIGHAVGSVEIDNRDVATSLGLLPDWCQKRTGIEFRRVCGAGEDVLSLAAEAVSRALRDAGLEPTALGPETVLLHIQNGFTHFAPPAGIVLAGRLGMTAVKVIGLDGVCAEPVAALDLAVTMLQAGRCERVIISAAVDFLAYIDHSDPDTAGLFGAGAGAIIVSSVATSKSVVLEGLHWETHAEFWDLAELRVLDLRSVSTGVELDCSYYTMKGQSLYRTVLQLLPPIIDRTLVDAGWSADDIDIVISHQPNPRQLELSARRLGLNPAVIPMPGRRLGNMGPASLLVNLSMARDAGALAPGTRALLLAFGIGFSCGAVALRVNSN